MIHVNDILYLNNGLLASVVSVDPSRFLCTAQILQKTYTQKAFEITLGMISGLRSNDKLDPYRAKFNRTQKIKFKD